jgi:hypothetical protein
MREVTVTKRSRFGGYVGLFTCALVALVVFSASPALAQEIVASGARSADGLWQSASDQSLPAAQRRADFIGPYGVMQLNRSALDSLLARAPNENDANRAAQPVLVTLPLPDGRFIPFSIEESPILAPEIAAAFPDIKTYRGSSLEDPTATARLDITPAGFHAMVIAAGGTVYIDPYTAGDLVNHVSYDKASLRRPDAPFRDLVEGETGLSRVYTDLPILNGTVRRTYRLALSATAQYVTAAGGTQIAALARMTTSVNRVNGIYEREVAVRLTLLTGTAGSPLALISTDPADYTNLSDSTMLGQNQARVDSIIGAANYDIGHVFGTGDGGVAYLGVVCYAPLKAGGVTGLPNPVTDAFDVDYVAHEIGHQFGGNHSFNGTAGNCGTRSASHAFEVGSGSTIMGYAGICAVENTQLNSNDLFTFDSLNEVTAFITTGDGSTCGVATATGNTLPVVTVPAASYTVPKETPFTLTAAASDINGDALTYIWEQHDLGTASSSVVTASTDSGNRPLFRSYVPTTNPSRTFPSLPYILNYANVPPQTYACSSTRTCLTGEVLPSLGRTMNFEVTVRDNRAQGGGIATAQTQVVVNAGVGPFAVTSPNNAVAWPALSTQTVTWSVNGANTLAANVRISLSLNGGATFPITLAASTPNDGTQAVTMPNRSTTRGRIKVEAVGNVFFDISNTDLSITGGAGGLADLAVGFGPANGLWLGHNPGDLSPEWTKIHAVSPTVMAAGDFDGNGQSDLAAVFPGYGVWIWTNNTSWVALHPLDATNIVTADLDGNGQDEIILKFANYGIWVRYNDASWTQLHVLDPSALVAGNIDGDADGRADLVVNFPGYGVWAFMNDATWVQVHGTDVNDMQVADMDGNGQDDVVLSFPGLGIWVRTNNSAWSKLHAQTSAGMTAGNIDGDGQGRKDLVINFPGVGVWTYFNNSSWVKLHAANASKLTASDLNGDGLDDVIFNFPGYGAWLWMDNASYVQLHGADAQGFAVGQFDSNRPRP